VNLRKLVLGGRDPCSWLGIPLFMQTRNTGIDFIPYDADESIVLPAEAKSRHNTSEAWAARDPCC
jgi:hypothetical protein